LAALGATNAQIAKALHDKFNVKKLTTRIVSHWRNNDAKLIALVDELEAIKRDLSPDDDLGDVLAKIPAPVDPAVAVNDLFGVCIRFPAFADLVKAGADPAPVLAAGYETDAQFEAACAAALRDHVPTAAPEDESGSFY
jgi:hypothetical protein